MYFDDFSFDENLDFFTGKKIMLNNDGYIYGNMFKDEYVPYKNYSVYRLNGKDEKERLKLKIMEETFIINDLNLYLDIHPNDEDMFNEFKKHNELLEEYKNEYENIYSSLCLSGIKNKYNWINSPWPWEVMR